MSHIPNSAMPHAAPSQPEEEQGSALSQAASGALDAASGALDSAVQGTSGLVGTVMEKVRNAPRGAVAAGAVLAGAAVAAAAIPLVKGALSDDKKSGGSKSASKSGGTGTKKNG